MDSLAERDVVARRARNIEAIGIFELRGVAIRGGENYEASLLRRQCGPA
jgi:hypothetical protein